MHVTFFGNDFLRKKITTNLLNFGGGKLAGYSHLENTPLNL